MDKTIYLQYGNCSIKVQTSDDELYEQFDEVAEKLSSWIAPTSLATDCILTVISPSENKFSDPTYRSISHTWRVARQKLKQRDSGSLTLWRELYRFGNMLNRSVFLFQDTDRENSFFCLNPTNTVNPPWRPFFWIVKAVEALGIHWHVTRGGAVFHASGVEQNGKGYLFLGQSGAGKSTVASLSEQAQGTIVHDDQVMLGFEAGHYLLAHPSSRITPPLRGIFLLKQSKEDCLVPLTPQATASGLGKSLLEYANGQDLYGPWVRQGFQNATAIARAIPGYELHFRKSPDFWKLIDEQFSD